MSPEMGWGWEEKTECFNEFQIKPDFPIMSGFQTKAGFVVVVVVVVIVGFKSKEFLGCWLP